MSQVLRTTAALLFAALATAAQAQRADEVRPDLIYHNYCSVCHGDRGDGRSRARNSLNPPPADFTGPQARETFTRARMILALQHGRPGTAMTAWTTQLSQKEIEAVVDYILDTMVPPAPGTPLGKGRALYAEHCVACHGQRGQGVTSSPSQAAPRPFSSASTPRAAMIATVAQGDSGRLRHGFAGRLKPEEIENTVDYVLKSLAPMLAPGVSGTYAHGGRGRDSVGTVADFAAPLPRGLTGNAQRGKQIYERNCSACHGANGDGNGPRSALLGARPRGLGATPLNRPALYAAIADGKTGTDMPAWKTVLEGQSIADLSEYLWRTHFQPARPAKTD
ncbi:MAG: c-type cytochrome [Burkholderiales bacterium]